MRKASLLTIFLIVFIDLIGFGILLPNQQYYGETFGIHNVFFLTLIGPAYSFFQFLFAPILGRWSDRAGRRPVLLLSQVGTLVGFLMLFGAHFVTNIPALAIFLLYFSRVLDGISGGNISIASAYIADITTPENRAKGYGIIGAAFGIGFVFGPAIGGIVGKHLGLQYVPLTAAVFSLAALLMTYFTLAESHHPGDKSEDMRRFSVTGFRHAMARPVIGLLIWLSFANGFAFAGMEQTFSLLIQERAFPVSPAQQESWATSTQAAAADAAAQGTATQKPPPSPLEISAQNASGASGYLFCGIGVIIALVQGGLIGRLSRSLGEAFLAGIGPILIAVGLVIVGTAGFYSGVWAALIVGTSLLAAGSSLFNPSLNSLISRHAGKHEQGEILGVSQGMASLARGVGPLLAGWLYWQRSSGWPYVSASSAWPYYASAAICLIVGVLAIALSGLLRPPANDQQPPGGLPVETKPRS